MKKHIVVLSLLLIGLFLGQTQVVQAPEETYELNIPADSGYNTFQVSLITSDSWQVDSTIDVAFKLTLTSKQNVLYQTKTNWVIIQLQGENFVRDSGTKRKTVTLRNIGDYWERKVYFNIPAEKLDRGQTTNVSITFVVSIDEIDNLSNYDNPMIVSLYRPLLSAPELYMVVFAIIVTIAGISGFVIYRRKTSGKS